jgi:hypothetical protein
MTRWKSTIGAAALCLGLAAPVQGKAPAPPPDVPAALRVPAGAKVVAQFHATGAQVYGCKDDKGKHTWTLLRPDALLHDAAGAVVGTHGAGPAWTLKDGSSVTGAKVAQAPAPTAGAVPWLLLRATAASGTGQLGQVTFVQRLNTVGGAPPDGDCAKAAGHEPPELRVNYAADYYFYTGGAAAAGH